MELSRLTKVQLREAWPHEASDFTSWLAEEENLQLLSDEIGIDTWHEQISRQVGKSTPVGGLFMPVPTAQVDSEAANNWLIEQLSKHPSSRGSVLVGPKSDRQMIAGYLENSQMVGFKPYHVFSEQKPTFQAPISSFIPEWVWQLADEYVATITLHMVKDRALADEDNQRDW